MTDNSEPGGSTTAGAAVPDVSILPTVPPLRFARFKTLNSDTLVQVQTLNEREELLCFENSRNIEMTIFIPADFVKLLAR
jgi:hypothetical protein